MSANGFPDEKLQKELAYYKKQLDQMSGESIRHDFVVSSLRHELKQKKEALSILVNLQEKFSFTTSLDTIFDETVRAINMQLSMDYSIVLIPAGSGYFFKASRWYGFQDDEKPVLETGKVEIPPAVCTPGQYILVNKSSIADAFTSGLQKIFVLTYFAGVPVVLDGKPIAFIISGRKFEKIPFVPPIDKGDADTLSAIAGLISTVVQNKNMMELKLQKAEVEKQNEAIAAQRDKLERALNELTNAQAQLVQREKMASLGELTAGIAHEIQNPLNFVNNFSDVSSELLQEMKCELEKGNAQDALFLAEDVKQNLEKILHHGKRADAIVKGMLQHSSMSTGQKEPTNINTLADEYLRLAYHGWRAKNKTFNATVKTEFNSGIANVNIVPQDIGRVILNLVNNAFYAVNERHALAGLSAAPSPELAPPHSFSARGQRNEADPAGKAGPYEPIIEVSSSAKNGTVEIKVKDNGIGIPQKLLDKIFQPFFTTKPTGQGTGLGLSLAYDIVKAHGGTLEVRSIEGEGSEFILQLPAA